MVSWRYKCLHIPSGEIWERDTLPMTFEYLMIQLNRWNIQGGEVWKYWYEG